MLESLSRHLLDVKHGVNARIVIVPCSGNNVYEFSFNNGTQGIVNIQLEVGEIPLTKAVGFIRQTLGGAHSVPCYCEHLIQKSQIIGATQKQIQEFCFLVDVSEIKSYKGAITGIMPITRNEFNDRVIANITKTSGD